MFPRPGLPGQRPVGPSPPGRVPRFITKYGTKQGILVLSKQVPLGIGAALGAGGNYGFGRLTVASARKIFGPPPTSWPERETALPSGTLEAAD